MPRHVLVIDKPVTHLLNDRDARQRKADEDDNVFLTADFDGKRIVCPKEENTRVCAWQSMQRRVCAPVPRAALPFNTNLRFFQTFKKNHDFEQVWLDVCREDKAALSAIRSYLRDYVESSRVSRPALHEKEAYETIQRLTTVKTVMTHWRSLVAHADNTLLRKKRREDPENRLLWTLRWDKGGPRNPPVTEISRV
jgi:hypothetical protein